MPLSQPPDHSKAVLILVIGISLGLIVYLLTSYKGPGVGDNIHSLPFGGYYQDGTKRIVYNSPQKQDKAFSIGLDKTLAFALLILLSFLIYVSERVVPNRNSCHNCVCSTHHS
uniref:Movement protein TGB2 n=1 Tax=Hibiscus chlorotic speck associated virus 1 TaxID=3143942 RepID=A0AAU7L1W8_9VIRU